MKRFGLICAVLIGALFAADAADARCRGKACRGKAFGKIRARRAARSYGYHSYGYTYYNYVAPKGGWKKSEQKPATDQTPAPIKVSPRIPPATPES